MNSPTPPRSPAPIAAPILCFGFLTATLMFCAWYLTHFPGVTLPPVAIGLILLAVMWIGMTAAGIVVGSNRAWKVGLGAGLLTATLDLLVLGAFIVKPATGDQPAPGFSGLALGNLFYVPGFLALGGMVGLVAATIAARIERTVRDEGVTVDRRIAALEAAAPGYWLSRLALVAVATVAPLLIVGGGVTSTQSGMAVPGWPDSYGANMFLYPINLMTGRVFFEHSHRLFGALAGLTFLALMVLALTSRTSRKARLWAVGLFLLVVIQGWIGGGGRVNLNDPYFGAAHGILAQIFFALTVAFAAGLSPLYQRTDAIAPDSKDRRRKALAAGLLHATLVQLALGALFRHLKSTPNPGATHILYTHAAFSMAVVIAAILAGLSLRDRANHGSGAIDLTLKRIGTGILAAVTLQFALGWAAFWFVATGGKPTPVPLAGDPALSAPIDALPAIVTTIHQANGALVLAMATLGVVWTRRVWRDRAAAQIPQPGPESVR